MNYPEELRWRYNEVMFDERDLLINFIKEQATIRFGNQMWCWTFEPRPVLHKRNDDYVSVESMRLYNGELEIFQSGDPTTPLFAEDFYYGELAKLIEELPEIDDIVKKNVFEDIDKMFKNYKLSAILKEHPFYWKDGNSEFHIEDVWTENGETRFEVHEIINGQQEGGYGIWEDLDKTNALCLQRHLCQSILLCSREYEKLTLLLRTREGGCYNFSEKNNFGAVSIKLDGTDVRLNVIEVEFDDTEGLHVFVSTKDTGLMCDDNLDVLKLFEADLTPDNLGDILKFFEEEIINTYNGHNEELVWKINDAWNNPKYMKSFAPILLALLTRDQKEYEDRYDTDASLTEEYAYGHAHEIMEGVCDDWDLETILSFIRYE